MPEHSDVPLATATFGGGCFWCTEAVFAELRGVKSVTSGYAGGDVDQPTYRQICNGDTGHAEVIQIKYDPAQIAYQTLLEVFFHTHDPTSLNRQGNDQGTQYRSVIFYHDEAQQRAASAYIQKLDAAGDYQGPIVTELSPAPEFFPAENYHQRYYALNASQPYCQTVIGPKLAKLRSRFGDQIGIG